MHFVNAAEVGSLSARKKRTGTASPLQEFVCRYFYLGMSFVFAGLVVWGFSRTVNDNLFHAANPRPLLLWIHGGAFSAWVIFFITQSSLVRTHNVSVHRSLGWFGAALGTAMVVLGIAIAIVMTRFDTFQLHQAGVDAFLSIPFYDMTAFGLCLGLAIYWRTKPEYHRRLLFIATCSLMAAPVARFDFVFNHNLFYLCLDLLMGLGIMRDWIVDRRINKVYFYALPALIVGQNLAIYLWRVDPAWWRGITHAIVG